MVTTLTRRPRLIAPVRPRDGFACETAPRSTELRLTVAGVLPADLDGCFLQARPHPTVGNAATVVEGIRLRNGIAARFRATDTGRRPCPFGPVAPVRLTETSPEMAAFPVRDGVDPVWHTVVTAPGSDHGRHLIVDSVGQVLHTRSFPLPHASLVRALAVTERHVVVLDLPVAYSRAADLVGERDPYVWQPDRGARIGLVPRCPEQVAAPVWFDIPAGYAGQVVGAHHESGRVILDAVWHTGPFDQAAGALAGVGSAAGAVVRWTLDPRTGLATARRLTSPVRSAVAAGKHLFTVATSARGAELTRRDLSTGEAVAGALEPGLVAGRPVLVPKTGRGASDCWLLLPVERVATREQELLVLDAADLAAGPVAVVRVPAGPSPAARSVWLSRPTLGVM